MVRCLRYLRSVATARAFRPLALAAAVGAGACVEIDGGAVEVNWVLRTPDGRAITDCGCSSPRVESVRVRLEGSAGTPCDGDHTCEFPCGQFSGATPFRIPPGRYAVSLIAQGPDGAELAEVGRPAPILRDVSEGQVTEMEAFPLIARCAENCSESGSSGACSRR